MKPLDQSAWVFQQQRRPRKRKAAASPSPSSSSTGVSSIDVSPSSALVLPSPSPPLSSSLITSPPIIASGYIIDPSEDAEEDLADTYPPARLSSHIHHHLSCLETYYLQYHVEQGSKLLANLENDENPLRSLIIPRAMTSPLILNAMCSLSAMHHANRLRERDSQIAATRYYIRTVRGIRKSISSDDDVIVSEESILAICLLCKYEVIRGSVKQWAVHLNALQRIIMSRGGLRTLDSDMADFLRGIIVYCQNVAQVTASRTGGGSMLATTTMTMPPAELAFPPSFPAKLDIYIGFTEDIIKLFARIAALYSRVDDVAFLNLEIFRM